MNKAFKVRLYPNKSQQELIDKTIGSCRFIYNQMLAERINVYEQLKDNKEELFSYKYKTEKQYKEEYSFLKEVPSRALQQSRNDLINAYKNFYRRIKQGKKQAGFPKFKKKGKCKDSYREPQVGNQLRIEEEGKKLNLPKLKTIKIKGLSKYFKGNIKSATIERTKSGKYFASILVEGEETLFQKERKGNSILGVDLGLKEFMTCSNGEMLQFPKDELDVIDKKIRGQQKHLSRKKRGSKRWEICRIKLNRMHDKKKAILNHFQWHLANKLSSENQVLIFEDLNVSGMLKNRKLSHSIHSINWSSSLQKIKNKSVGYKTELYQVGRFFPSSKLCSNCGRLKEHLTLGDRTYICDCGIKIDRDLNAAINLKKNYFVSNNLSLEYSDYRRGKEIKPMKLVFDNSGIFVEASNRSL